MFVGFLSPIESSTVHTRPHTQPEWPVPAPSHTLGRMPVYDVSPPSPQAAGAVGDPPQLPLLSRVAPHPPAHRGRLRVCPLPTGAEAHGAKGRLHEGMAHPSGRSGFLPSFSASMNPGAGKVDNSKSIAAPKKYKMREVFCFPQMCPPLPSPCLAVILDVVNCRGVVFFCFTPTRREEGFRRPPPASPLCPLSREEARASVNRDFRLWLCGAPHRDRNDSGVGEGLRGACGFSFESEFANPGFFGSDFKKIV